MILTAIRFAQSFREVEALSERLLVIDNLKDEFMANTSHELRTPLHGIINIAQSMLEGAAGAVTPKQARNLSMITSTGKRLSLLVNDILDFSKLKNSEIELKREAVDLESVARTVVEVSGFTFGDKPIVLIQDWPPSLPLVEADEDRLRQILYNLIGNAYKYTQQGEIRLYAIVQGIRSECQWRIPELALLQRSWRIYSSPMSRRMVQVNELTAGQGLVSVFRVNL